MALLFEIASSEVLDHLVDQTSDDFADTNFLTNSTSNFITEEVNAIELLLDKSSLTYSDMSDPQKSVVRAYTLNNIIIRILAKPPARSESTGPVKFEEPKAINVNLIIEELKETNRRYAKLLGFKTRGSSIGAVGGKDYQGVSTETKNISFETGEDFSPV